MGDSVSSLHRRRASYSDSQFVAAQNVLLTMSPAADICTRQTGVIDSPQHSLEGLICFAPLAILELDPEGKIRRWNPAAERLFGWTESEVLGRANPLIAIEARAQYEAEVRHILKGATIQGKDVRRQHKDGRWIDARLWAAPIRKQCGAITGIIAILEDVTDQKEDQRELRLSQARQEEMEVELQRNEERMRLALEAAKAGCWDWNLLSGEMVWSAAASRQMGLPEDSPTSFELFMNSVHPEDRAVIQEAIEAGLHDDKDPYVPYRMIWPDGSVHWRAVAGRVFRDPAGRPLRMLGIGLDLDESHAANERLLLQAAALQAAANAIVITDNQGTILWTNQAFSQLTGYGPEEVLGRNPRLLKSGRQDRAFYADLWATITSGKTWQGEIVNRRKDGSFYTEGTMITPVHIGTGAITHYVAIKQDITARKFAEEQLRRAEEKYRAIFENALVGIFQTSPEGRPISINRALARIHGYDTPAQLLAEVSDVGRQLFVEPGAFKEFLQVLGTEGTPQSVECEVYSRDGSKKWALANVRAATDADSNVLFYEGMVEDITERKAAEQRVQFLAYYDALTGLPNRALLRDRILVALASARRHREKVALLFLDLDRFKTINDSLGHSVGDLLLQEVAERLKAATREPDTVARLGGDEFLLLMTAVNETADAVKAAERIVKSMAGEFVIQGNALHVTCSVGISIFPDNGDDIEALFKNADLAMYSAKEHGRNVVRLFTHEMNVQAMERMTLERSLRMAVERNELFLVYQPQEDLATSEIIGCEALLRWRHPDLGLVAPQKFIPVAESSGLIVPIGEWVLRTACAQARLWQDEGLPAMPVAVNVSAVQFRRASFLRLVKTVLRDTGLAPQYLELELTESLILSNTNAVLEMLKQLEEMGVKLSIDDFGTGYSSLSYLKQFPVHKLKIDGSFVRDVNVDVEDAAIVSSILSMARNLGLKVVAECVENEAQASFLRAHQCDEIQGYYFSEPLTADALAEKLRSTSHMAFYAQPALATEHV